MSASSIFFLRNSLDITSDPCGVKEWKHDHASFLMWKLNSICDKGGFSHAPDDLTYGVDMRHIRWCGILQVTLIFFFFFLLEKEIQKTIAFINECYHHRELL